MARRFGATWWGRAWIDAIENRASLDPNRLPRGRTYARQGHVLSVETQPGSIRALVSGRRRDPYRIEIRFRTFDDDEWDRLLDVIVSRAGRTAALLDGELHPGIVEDASEAGVGLLPHAGELQPRCSCPDRADPCKHAAAVCYLVSHELDNDPFVLLELRGRDREEVLAGVRVRRAGRLEAGMTPGDVRARSMAAGRHEATEADPGVRASEAWARALGPLPSIPPPPPQRGRPAVIPFEPPSDAPFSASGLDALAADASARAWASLNGEPTLQLDLPAEHDLVRRAAGALSEDIVGDLARRTGTTPRALARRAIAWQVAGAPAVDALTERPWRADLGTMAVARQSLIDAGVAPTGISTSHNRITVDTIQLRLSHRGAWWLFLKRGAAWELDAGPATEPDELLLRERSQPIGPFIVG